MCHGQGTQVDHTARRGNTDGQKAANKKHCCGALNANVQKNSRVGASSAESTGETQNRE